MICTVCIRPEVSANRELSPKHFCLSQCTIGFRARCVALLCEPRPSSLIVWTADVLNKCKIFSSHFLNQIFHDWWYYYRISWQCNFSVGTHSKNKELKEKKHTILGSWCRWTFTWRLSEVTQREDALESVQIKILHGNISIEQMMGEISSLMVRPLVHQVFLKTIRGLFLF